MKTIQTVVVPEISSDDQRKLQAMLVALFGGFTRTAILGGWKNGRGEVEIEYGHQYAVVSDQIGWTNIVYGLGVLFKQQEMYYTIDGKPAFMEIPEVANAAA